MRASDLFPPKTPAAHRPATRTAATARRFDLPCLAAKSIAQQVGSTLAGWWPYFSTDDGDALTVLRFDLPDGGKTYRPICPSNGGWSIGDPRGPLPLYRLAGLNGAARVYVLEGEKCADAAAGLGLAATTSAHGAKSAGRTDWTPLAGRDVVILPDNDANGEAYAADVARILAGLTPLATVRVVRLPDLPPKCDVVDFLNARDAQAPADLRREIEALADAAPPWTPPAEATATGAERRAGCRTLGKAPHMTATATLELLTVAEANGRFTITARLNGESLTDRLLITSAKSRAAFVNGVCKHWPQINRADVERVLEGLAKQHVEARAARPDAAADGELDAATVFRPEQFFTPDVSGLAIPVIGEYDGRPVGRWALLLQWADGHRERRDLSGRLSLPDGKTLWLAPSPAEPSPMQARSLCGWSPAGRRAWLSGAPVPDPADVFKRVCGQVAHFLDLGPPGVAAGTTATLALWVLMTYMYSVFDAIPYLYIGGPLASGKSRVFEVLNRMVFRPLHSSSMTGPCLFRTLHDRGGTLLLDEAERLRQPGPEQSELLAMLLAGYKRGGTATRLEPVGDSFRPVEFAVYGPKALASINSLPPALASRCITMRMFRAGPESPKPRCRIDAEPDAWRRLRDDLHALAVSNGLAWLILPGRADACPLMPGRAFELWQPLLSLAAYLEGHGATGLLALMQAHALASVGAGLEDQTPDSDETLLRFLAEELRAGNRPTPGEILSKAVAAEPVAFRMWTAKGVAEHLRRYGLVTCRVHGRKVYNLRQLDVLAQVQAAYGVDLDFRKDTPLGNVPPCAPTCPQASLEGPKGT